MCIGIAFLIRRRHGLHTLNWMPLQNQIQPCNQIPTQRSSTTTKKKEKKTTKWREEHHNVNCVVEWRLHVKCDYTLSIFIKVSCVRKQSEHSSQLNRFRLSKNVKKKIKNKLNLHISVIFECRRSTLILSHFPLVWNWMGRSLARHEQNQI